MKKQYEIPVIFLTAKDDLSSKIQGLKGGAEDYIVKPFEILELLVLERLAVYMLLITLGVTVVTLVILYLVLNRVLQPLRELNDTTKRMTENVYGQRVTIRRRDEIGELGESFNRMAEAVEARTRSLEESEKQKTLFMGNLTHE